MGRTSEWLVLTAVLCAVGGCSGGDRDAVPSSGATSAASADPGTAEASATSTTDTTPQASDADRELVERLLAFARSPTHEALAAVPLAGDGIRLGLGEDLLVERSASELLDPASWTLTVEAFRGSEGQFSILDQLAQAEATEVSVGPHPHCASPPVPAPAEVAHLRRLGIQPTGTDICLQWFSVDVFLDERGAIRAITLDLWEP